MARAKRANRDAGIAELIGRLEAHPRLVRALIFDHAKVERLLRSAAARRLLRTWPGWIASGRRSTPH